jgi:hypothetical protein
MAVQSFVSKNQARELARTDNRVEAMETVERQLSTRAEFAGAIRQAWGGIEKRYLLIGHYLLQAKQKLEHGEYLELIDRDLPFSRNNAYRMREVAEAIDNGRLPIDRLPNSFSILYEAATLTEGEWREAEKRGLIHADVKRQEILNLKRELRVPVSNRENALKRRREQIVAMQRKLAEELRQIDAMLDAAVIDGEAVEVAD